jgi:hypothetical protein
MMTIKIPRILLLLGIHILSVGCSCSDRPVDETEREEQLHLCERKCEADAACLMTRDEHYTPQEREGCRDRCLEIFFNEHNVGCEVVAARAVECIIAHGPTCEGNSGCTEEKQPFSVCIADPKGWAARDCDDKCPGECCTARDD